MKQVATVDRLLADGRAEIVVARQSACAHDCRECAGCGAAAASIRAVAVNPIGAREGQKVVVESSSRQIFGAILLVYMLPVLFFFAAYFLAAPFGSGVSALVSILAFFCGIVPSVFCDRRLRRSGGMTFTIVSIF